MSSIIYFSLIIKFIFYAFIQYDMCLKRSTHEVLQLLSISLFDGTF